MPITHRKNKVAIVHSTANLSLTVVGNSSVSNVATGNEIITGASIRQVFYGGNGGYWEIKRGANTVAVLSGTYHMNYAGEGLSLSYDPAATIVANYTGSGPAYIMLEIAKQTPNTSEY